MNALMESEAIQAEIDIAYQNMMAARTETAERYWCDRLKVLAGRKKFEADTKKPEVLA